MRRVQGLRAEIWSSGLCILSLRCCLAIGFGVQGLWFSVTSKGLLSCKDLSKLRHAALLPKPFLEALLHLDCGNPKTQDLFSAESEMLSFEKPSQAQGVPSRHPHDPRSPAPQTYNARKFLALDEVVNPCEEI